jgi:hypothetical protein
MKFYMVLKHYFDEDTNADPKPSIALYTNLG